MRPRLLFALLLIPALVIARPTPITPPKTDSPSEVLDKVWNFFLTADIEGLRKVIYFPNKEIEEKVMEEIKDSMQNFPAGKATCKPLKEFIDKELALVAAKMTIEENTDMESIYFIKVRGKWYLLANPDTPQAEENQLTEKQIDRFKELKKEYKNVKNTLEEQ